MKAADKVLAEDLKKNALAKQIRATEREVIENAKAWVLGPTSANLDMRLAVSVAKLLELEKKNGDPAQNS